MYQQIAAAIDQHRPLAGDGPQSERFLEAVNDAREDIRGGYASLEDVCNAAKEIAAAKFDVFDAMVIVAALWGQHHDEDTVRARQEEIDVFADTLRLELLSQVQSSTDLGLGLYRGHTWVRTASGRQGLEAVIIQAVKGRVPVTIADGALWPTVYEHGAISDLPRPESYAAHRGYVFEGQFVEEAARAAFLLLQFHPEQPVRAALYWANMACSVFIYGVLAGVGSAHAAERLEEARPGAATRIAMEMGRLEEARRAEIKEAQNRVSANW